MTSRIEIRPKESIYSNVSGLLDVMSTYIRWRKLEQFSGHDIAVKYGDQIRQNLSRNSHNRIPVLVCARNEEHDLPRLLLALSQQNVKVLVVDNASTDGTVDIAQSLGAEVILEPNPGLSMALAAGFIHLKDTSATEGNRLLLLTDADTYPVSGWSESMKKATGQQLSQQTGGILTGPVVAAGSGILQDAFRTTTATAKDIYYTSRNYVSARGPNSAVLLDSEGRIINALAHDLDPEIFIGQDQMVQDTVVSAGGADGYNWSPQAVVIMRGDRYGSIRNIIRTFLNPNRIALYDDYPRPNGSTREYLPKTHVKLGKY